MRAILLAAAALLAAGCAAGPEESMDDIHAGDRCPEDASAYHEAGTGGAASSEPAPEPVPAEKRMGGDACPGGIEDESIKETIDER